LWYAVGLLAFVGLALSLAYSIWYGTAKRRLDAAIARVVDRGEPVWFKDLAPTGPAKRGDDGAQLFLAAINKLQPLDEAALKLIDAESGTPPGVYPPLEVALEAYREALELMRQAIGRPYLRLPLDYQTKQPLSLLLEPIQRSRDFARLLQMDVLQSLGKGDVERATAAVRELFALSETLRDEPFMITQLVRVAIGSIAVKSLETLLAHHDRSPEQFTAIDNQITDIGSRFVMAPSVIAERASAMTSIRYLAQGPMPEFLDPGGAPVFAVMSSGPMKPYMMNNQAFLLDAMCELVDNVDKTGPAGRDAVQAVMDRVSVGRTRHMFAALLMPAVMQFREAGMRFRSRLAGARLGMRVDRFHAARGQLPASLDDVLDERLTAVPVDVYSGKPLVFKPQPSSFAIYPVGDDGADGGGDADQQERFGRFEVKYPQGESKDSATSPPSNSQQP
jgi:hypothetical protein